MRYPTALAGAGTCRGIFGDTFAVIVRLSNCPPAIIAFTDRLIALIPQLITFFQTDNAS
jgi:hypothetical protein